MFFFCIGSVYYEPVYKTEHTNGPFFLIGAHLFHWCRIFHFTVISEEEHCNQREAKSFRSVSYYSQSCIWQCLIAKYP
jgi:hypothetical protein